MENKNWNYFDGMSIGSNDLTQLTLGLDRDSSLVAEAFNEQDPSIKKLLKLAIQACKKEDNRTCSFCGLFFQRGGISFYGSRFSGTTA